MYGRQLRCAKSGKKIDESGIGKTPIAASCAYRGITAVELLICLALVLLIFVMVLPLLGHARADANRSNCINNMHQCGLAVGLYSEDYDNYYPTYRVDKQSVEHKDDPLYWHDRFCRATLVAPGQPNWASVTRSYAVGVYHRLVRPGSQKSSFDDVYHCPSDEKRRSSVTSYEYKMWLATFQPGSEIHVPGSTVILWEQWGFHDDDLGQGKASEYDRRADLNVVFVDQHSAYLSLSHTVNARYGHGPNLHWFPADEHMPASPDLPPLIAFQDVLN